MLVHSPEVIVPETILGRKLEELSMHIAAIKTTIADVESSGAPLNVAADNDLDDDGLSSSDSQDDSAKNLHADSDAQQGV